MRSRVLIAVWKRNSPILLATAGILSSTITVNAAPSDIIQTLRLHRQVDDVVSHLKGAMDTSAQAQTKANAPNVRITTCKISVRDATTPNLSTFLYQEQALTQRLSKPYRQRFLRIAPSAEQTGVESAIFKPPTPSAWIGLCNQPEAARVVTTKDLGKSECSVLLRRRGKNYVGETQPGGCPSNYQGAVRITNRIILHQTGMDTWDRGFDAQGNQVWGAKSNAYQFRWITPKSDRN